jgi:hypothetical protein
VLCRVCHGDGVNYSPTGPPGDYAQYVSSVPPVDQVYGSAAINGSSTSAYSYAPTSAVASAVQ